MTTPTNETPDRRLPSFPVPWSVLGVAGLMVVGLLALSGAYGFHRDELYFIVAGRHPALGYVDQPPLTPLISAAAAALLGVSATAVRVLPALAVGLIAILTALMARDFGGTRRAQLIAAVTVAASGYLAVGHLDDTAEYDLLAWAIVLWLLVRLLAGGDRRLWLAVGVTAGIGLENKDTVLLLGGGLAVGVLVARRWDIVRSPWAWAAVGIAILIWVPNLAWEVVNGFPQFTMASHIAGNAADNRAQIVPLLWLFSGPFVFVVSIAGWWWMLRANEAAAWRPIVIGSVVVLVLVVVSGGKGYYAVGILPPFMAAGAIVTDRWMSRGRRRLRAGAFIVAAALSCALVAYLTLPVLPIAAFASSSLPTTFPDSAEQVGWPELVSTVEGVVAGLSAADRSQGVILTNNYGEAGALSVLGTGLPPVYSGHNAWWAWGPPQADRTVVVHVGDWTAADWSPYFIDCQVAAHIDDGVGVENQEQGQAISVCRGLRQPWATMWPSFRHID